MKKLKFEFRGKVQNLKIKYPNSLNYFYANFLRIGDYLSTLLMYFLVLLLPLSFRFFQDDVSFYTTETGSFRFISIFLIIGIFILFAELVIYGGKRFFDLPGLIPMLTFSLLMTLIIVLSGNQEAADTFGTLDTSTEAGVKSFASISVIAFISSFFLFGRFFRSVKQKNIFLNLFVLGSFISMIIFDLPVEGFKEYIFIYLLSSVIIINRIFENKNYLHYFWLVALGIFGIRLFSFFREDNADLIIYFLSAGLITLLIQIAYLAVNQKGSIKLFIEKVKNLFKSNEKSGFASKTIEVVDVFRAISPIVLGLLIILISSMANINILEQLRSSVDGFTNSFEVINQDTSNLFLGQGASQSDDGLSLIANVLLVHGLLGLITYLVIWLWGIYLSFDILNKKDEFNSLNFVTSFYLIFLPVIGLIFYPGFVAVLLWFIFLGFALTHKLEHKISLKDFLNTNGLSFINFATKEKARNIKMVIVTLIFIICVIFLWMISQEFYTLI